MKKIITALCVIFINLYAHSSNAVSICLSPVYIVNDNAVTLFYNKHFSFEILFSYEQNDRYEVEILAVDYDENENKYLRQCKAKAVENGFDYLLYSNVYSSEKNLFFKVQLINPYNNIIEFSNLYVKNNDYSINESLAECAGDIIETLNSKELKQNEKLVFTVKKNRVEDITNKESVFQSRMKYSHEVFVLNGFFKTHANVMTFMEICTGYNFTPFDFFAIEGALFLGMGDPDSNIELNKLTYKNFFIGTYIAFNIYYSGIVEPNVGLRLEIDYVVQNDVYFSIPFDFGLKFYINSGHAIRINSSFQFTCFNLATMAWENNFVVGFFIGYAKKI